MAENTSIDRLCKVLQYDPAKQSGSNSSVFNKALQAVQERRDKEIQAKAEELLQQAIDLRCKMDESERQFNANKKKFEKELGKLVNRIEAYSRGESSSAVDAKETEEASEGCCKVE